MNKVIPVDQTLDTGDEKWSGRSCGVCVLKMLMVFKKPEYLDIPVMTLLNQALKMGGYIDGIGWKHRVLADLASKYGIGINYRKEFFDTFEKKKIGIKIIDKILRAGSPVAVSVLKGFNIPGSAHLVVIDGVKTAKIFGLIGRITGYEIVDPYPGERGSRYAISREEFLSGWRGGMLWLIHENLKV